MRPATLALPFAVLLGGAAAPLYAQVIQGTVRDADTGAPIESAGVLLLDRDGVPIEIAVTDSLGRFHVAAPASVVVRLQVERIGYGRILSTPVLLAEEAVAELDVSLRYAPIPLEEVRVSAGMSLASERRLEFEKRRRSGAYGDLFGPEEVARINYSAASTRLAALVPRLWAVGQPGNGYLTFGLPGGPLACEPTVYVNGWKLPAEISLDAFVMGASIRAVESYREPGWAPGEFQTPFQTCGIVVIWTDHAIGELPWLREDPAGP